MTLVQPTWTEAPPARDWPMQVAGIPVEAADGRWLDVHPPSRPETLLARVPRGGAVDVDRAVNAAREAFPGWRAMHFTERQRRLLAIADAVEAHADELARLTAVDTGNAVRTQARPECRVLVDLFRYFGGVAGEVKGVVLPAGDGQLQYSVREPLGVVGAILPWNSPLMIAGMKIPAALAAGNTMVVKAAEDAPLTVLRLAELCAPFLPDGVLNVITGLGIECGAHLVRHPGVDKVSFTGSTAVGLDVGKAAAERLIPASLELGGKNPNIVWPDAVSEETIDGILTAMRFTRQGQSCTAGSRLFLHRSIFDEVLDGLVRKVAQLRIGDPLDEATDMGCLINAKQHRRVASYIEEGLSTPGVSLVYDGADMLPAGLEGYYHAPTIFSGDNEWRLAREEIFGPVMVVVPWEDDDEVLAMANDSNYGLAAYLWCKDVDRALGAARRIEAGWVQVNQGGGQMVGQSYGGFKQSGIGREVSLEGMLEGFTQIKQINVRLSR
ncbi:aldehyde dehydrogenase family protein [Rhodococcus sp. T2V]|uniref:aldehyde dehydrogenase family protein n=1 Tax=Rhodococcus sp. T2V TaxID=3034164 RepID=UPI0023E29064|nr:aldehyde dehydrogenase family protein [Rhodococcus sp. T2V]MDF3309607.1 aldehyde dehydrogenase family protein [Rhodococcus sp. T2V]